MRRFLRDRLLQAVGVVFLVTTLTFLLVHLAPGDPIANALERPGVTEAVRAQWRAQFGLDRPMKYKSKPGRTVDSMRAELLMLMQHVEQVVPPDPTWRALRASGATGPLPTTPQDPLPER